jgi:hypothetical protein
MCCAAGSVEDGGMSSSCERALLVGGEGVGDDAFLLGRACMSRSDLVFSISTQIRGFARLVRAWAFKTHQSHPMSLNSCVVVSCLQSWCRMAQSMSLRGSTFHVLASLWVGMGVGLEDPSSLHAKSRSCPHYCEQ